MKLKEMLETRKISKNILKVIGLVLFMTIFNSLSYAYFTSNIEGEGKEMVITTSDISIRFTDNEAIKKTGLTPGDTITKTFSITNNSEGKVEYKINWEYLINNFVNREYLVYEVSSTNGGGSLSETQLPDSEEHINILNNITINPGVTQEYTMIITYKNSGSNQDADKNKSLIGKLEITDLSGNSILPETSTGSSSSPIDSEQGLYGLKVGDLVDVLYPVGSIYTSTNSTDPSEIMGGKWERYGEGKTLIGVDESDSSFNTVEKTGGSKSINLAHSHTVNSHTHTTQDHTLTIDEMPSHQHRSVTGYNGEVLDFFGGSGESSGITHGTVEPISNSSGYYAMSSYTGGGGAHNHGSTTASSPGTNSKLSNSQSILNPYITVYMWKRIS